MIVLFFMLLKACFLVVFPLVSPVKVISGLIVVHYYYLRKYLKGAFAYLKIKLVDSNFKNNTKNLQLTDYMK